MLFLNVLHVLLLTVGGVALVSRRKRLMQFPKQRCMLVLRKVTSNQRIGERIPYLRAEIRMCNHVVRYC